jgi:hypothetical protein
VRISYLFPSSCGIAAHAPSALLRDALPFDFKKICIDII